MKKILLQALFALFLILHTLYFPCRSSITTSRADTITPSVGDYACILSEDTFFYASADERRGLFLLPKTYYVRLLEYGSEYCKIEYQKDDGTVKRLVGYAKTEKLTFVEYTPSRPYLSYIFDVTYIIDSASTETASAFLNEITLTCVYYGDYKIGSETYCYILRGDEYGYIPKPASISYEENTEYADYLASLVPENSEEAPADESSTNSPMQIAILIAVCILVPVLAALILRSPRRPPYETEE